MIDRGGKLKDKDKYWRIIAHWYRDLMQPLGKSFTLSTSYFFNKRHEQNYTQQCYSSRILFLAIRQAPITPALSFSLESTNLVSRFTKLSEYFNTDDLIACIK